MDEKDRIDPVLYDRDLDESEAGDADQLTESSGKTEDRGGCLLNLWFIGLPIMGILLTALGAPQFVGAAAIIAGVAPMAGLMLGFFAYSAIDLWRDHGLLFILGLLIWATISYAAFKSGGSSDCDLEMNMTGQLVCVGY